jgi:hypothetical protein
LITLAQLALGNLGRVLRQPVDKGFIAVSRWEQNPADVTVHQAGDTAWAGYPFLGRRADLPRPHSGEEWRALRIAEQPLEIAAGVEDAILTGGFALAVSLYLLQIPFDEVE